MKFLRLLPILLLSLPLFAQPRTLYYSFRTDHGGGLARITANPESGEVLAHDRLFTDTGAAKIRKVAVSQCGRFVTANLDGVEERNNLLVLDLQGNAPPRYLSLPGAVDPIGFFHNKIFAGSDTGALHRIDPETLALEASWNFRQRLTPGGRRPEDLFLDGEANILWVSFQKDDRRQRHRGSRIVGISLANDEIIADLQLPRDRPELHYSIEVDGREAGPNPEVLHISPATNTLFVTLDLYGAVGMADLDAARRGELKNWSVLSTAPDGSFGTAFPDRIAHFVLDDREHLAVANASAAGGVAIVDLTGRSITRHLPAPGGLTTLAYLPSVQMLVSGSAGKNKARTESGLSNVSVPLSIWCRFQHTQKTEFRPVIEEMGLPVLQTAVLGPDSPWVFLNLGEHANIWRILHALESTMQAEFEAFGSVQRTARPGR